MRKTAVLISMFVIGCVFSGCFAKDKVTAGLNPDTNSAGASVVYHDARMFGIQGRGWPEKDMECCYDRLPIKAKNIVRELVWKLSQDSAGMYVDFVTDSNAIFVKYTLKKDSIAMNHMPATGVSGMDIYTLDKNRWQVLGVVKTIKYPETKAVIAGNLNSGTRRYRIYLPLYNGVNSFEIGIRAGSFIEKIPAKAVRKPIVFYGTSITQGGCASRPGMCYTNILGRLLDRPIVNLGFSGNGKMEPEMAKLVAEIDADVYVLDALPNLTQTEAAQRIEPFIITLRDKHPDTPIVLAEFVSYPNMEYVKHFKDRVTGDNEALQAAYKSLKAKGYKGLYIVPRDALVDADGEGMVDTVHPTDLGFMKMAKGFEPVLKGL